MLDIASKEGGGSLVMGMVDKLGPRLEKVLFCPGAGKDFVLLRLEH